MVAEFDVHGCESFEVVIRGPGHGQNEAWALSLCQVPTTLIAEKVLLKDVID